MPEPVIGTSRGAGSDGDRRSSITADRVPILVGEKRTRIGHDWPDDTGTLRHPLVSIWKSLASSPAIRISEKVAGSVSCPGVTAIVTVAGGLSVPMVTSPKASELGLIT